MQRVIHVNSSNEVSIYQHCENTDGYLKYVRNSVETIIFQRINLNIFWNKRERYSTLNCTSWWNIAKHFFEDTIFLRIKYIWSFRYHFWDLFCPPQCFYDTSYKLYVLYNTLLSKKIARAPGGHKKFMLTKLGGRNRIDPNFLPLFWSDFKTSKE